MYNYERRQKILELLLEQSPLRIDSLVARLDTTPATIRRDLVSLENEGLIIRSRGIVRLSNTPFYAKNTDVPVYTKEKVAIAKAAYQLIPQGVSIILDSGTTTLMLTDHLAERRDLTIITNSITAADRMAPTGVSTIVVGGNLFGDFHALVGPDTEAYFSRISADILFLATTGIRKDELTTMTPFQASLKHKMVQCAQKVILLADERKFSINGIIPFAKFSEIDCVITSAPIQNSETVQLLEKNNVEMIIAEP